MILSILRTGSSYRTFADHECTFGLLVVTEIKEKRDKQSQIFSFTGPPLNKLKTKGQVSCSILVRHLLQSVNQSTGEGDIVIYKQITFRMDFSHPKWYLYFTSNDVSVDPH
ncbi:hypothetical protein TNCV_2773851 [Trichonephila clavipes]|nr:hypothetical protein TNCV_2773851 [Trichonephila clavipes]